MPGAMAATDPLHARPDGLPSDDDLRVRREIRDIPTRVDRLFDRVTFGSGMVVLGLLLLVGYFLMLRSRLAFQSQGLAFFTRAVWNTANGKPALGVLGLLVGTVARGRSSPSSSRCRSASAPRCSSPSTPPPGCART